MLPSKNVEEEDREWVAILRREVRVCNRSFVKVTLSANVRKREKVIHLFLG